MKFLKDIDFKHKRVLLRVDFNVPIKNEKVLDDWRIKISLPTIEHILKQPKSKLVIVSHLGRPGGKPNPKLSLKPVVEKLKKLLKRKVIFIKNIISEDGDKIVRGLGEGEIALAENIRFYSQEEDNDENFAIELCHNFGVYVNDAFSVSHRKHASVVSIPKYKPSCAGLAFEKEIKELYQAAEPSKRPCIAIIGGAKIETKLPVIEGLSKNYDVVLAGGRVAVEAREKKVRLRDNVILPEDYIDKNMDIGPRTIEKYKAVIEAASFLIWNGAMGKFEENKYARGTQEILKALCKADAYKIAGGGETIEFISSQRNIPCFDFISSGGGAMLEFLSGKKLPGIEALEKY